MGARQKPSKWDGVIPETLESYVGLCKYQFLRNFPIDINTRMRDDITQEMKTLAWEAKSKGMDVPQASRQPTPAQGNHVYRRLDVVAADF